MNSNNQTKTATVRAHAAAFFKGFAQGCAIAAAAHVAVIGVVYLVNKNAK